MVRRGRLVLFLLSLIFILILINLFRVMYYNPAQSVVSSQSQWTLTVSESRGTIYDRHLVPLVNSEPQYRAACVPSIETLPFLNGILTEKDRHHVMNSIKQGVPFVVPLLKDDSSRSDILTFLINKRYAIDQLAVHLIGYCQNGKGASGVELAYDKLLKDYSGSLTVTFGTNGHGQQLSGVNPFINDSSARSAGGVSLTLDTRVQSALEDTTAGLLSKGAVVVLSPNNGDVLACVSYPSFHPEAVSEAIEANDGALINRAISLYDCGSVFKIVTAAAALESGVSADTTYTCNGSVDIGGTVFHCHNRNGHGVLSMTQAFSVSCNTYFIQLAQDIGADTIYTMANTMGFGKRISLAKGITTPVPLLPDRKTLQQPAALANLSFGQGYLMTTPLHVAQIVATVANKGVMPPIRLIKSFIDENMNEEELSYESSYTVLSAETAKRLQQMLYGVVEEGTGRAAKPRNTTAAGKTGTAETGQFNGSTPVVQSWFAGYFPVDHPQYVVVVLAEDSATTGENAASIFCEISNKLFDLGIAGDK